jgi:tRNA A37 threonylcarbamoyladenosine dehydratase
MSMDRLYGSCEAAPLAAAGLERRFGGVARLYGAASLARFGAARVAVVGLGGVGTWAAEALARSGVGNITLIDLDHISESNTNRQIHALDPDYGKAKVQAMAQRVRAIHPAAAVREVEEFVTPDNAATLLRDLDLVIDCIDEVAAKAALIAHGCSVGLAVITCGGAGGRRDPSRIRCDDLARTQGDALLASVRQRLRRDHGFTRAARSGRPAPFGIEAVFSDEPVVRAFERPDAIACDRADADVAPGSPLACGGFGSAVTVTASMGFAAAARALEHFCRA